MKFWDRIGFVCLAGLLVIAMTVPAVILLIAWDDKTSRPERDPVYSLGTSARTVVVGASYDASWAENVVVRAPRWEGVVTSVLVDAGEPVVDGSPILRLNGIEIRHYVLDSPFYQAVCEGDTILASEMRHVLELSGAGSGSGDRVNRDDLAGMRRYAAEIGIADAKGLSCFDPGWILTSPDGMHGIDKINVKVGMEAPALGETVLEGIPLLAAFRITGDSGSEVLNSWLEEDDVKPFGKTELIVAGERTGIDLADLKTAESLEQLSELITRPDEAGGEQKTGLAVELTLTSSQYVVPATAVVEPLGKAPCLVQVGPSGRTLSVLVIASAVSGLVVDIGAASDPGQVLAAPGRVACE
jgi:hypothetical protein